MKNVMKRAWEIYRTLTGDRLAKLSQALKMAWAEVRETAKKINHVVFAYDIKVVDGDKIAVSAPKNRTATTNQELTFIREHKAEIITFIKKKEAKEAKEKSFVESLKVKYAKEIATLERITNKTFAADVIRYLVNGESISSATAKVRVAYADWHDGRI